jgi:hypothetical protein
MIGWVALLIAAGTWAYYRWPGSAVGQLPAMPFPPGAHIVVVDGRRVLVRVPAKIGRLRVLLYGHGFGQTIEDVDAQIGEAVTSVIDPPVLVIPQLGPKSELGDLVDPGKLHALVAGALGRPSWGTLDAMAHSGGYRLAALATLEVTPRSVALLDALYGQATIFSTYARKGHRVVSIFGPTTKDETLVFVDQCKAAKVATTLIAEPSDRLQVALVRKATATALATSVFHPDVPKVYAAPLAVALNG